MIRAVSRRERRLVAVLILTAVVAAAYGLLVGPLLQGFAAREARRAQLALLFAHNQRTIATIPALRRQAERQRDAIARFAAAASTVEAGRELLKSRLQGAVEHVGGEVREGGDGEGRPGWARARVAARLTLPQLRALLDLLEAEPPWLVIETLGVRAPETPASGDPSVLDIDLEASIPLRPAIAR